MVGEVCLSVAAASTWPFAPFCKAAQEGARKKKEKKSKRGLKKKENVRRKTCLSAAAFVVTRRRPARAGEARQPYLRDTRRHFGICKILPARSHSWRDRT